MNIKELILRCKLINDHIEADRIRAIALENLKNRKSKIYLMVSDQPSFIQYIKSVIKHFDNSATLVRNYQTLRDEQTWQTLFVDLNITAQNKLRKHYACEGHIEENANDYAVDVLMKCAKEWYAFETPFEAWLNTYLNNDCANGSRKAGAHKRKAEYEAIDTDFGEYGDFVRLTLDNQIGQSGQIEDDYDFTVRIDELFDEEDEIFVEMLLDRKLDSKQVMENMAYSSAKYYRHRNQIREKLTTDF